MNLALGCIAIGAARAERPRAMAVLRLLLLVELRTPDMVDMAPPLAAPEQTAVAAAALAEVKRAATAELVSQLLGITGKDE